MDKYPQSGYSWLGFTADAPKHFLTTKDKKMLEGDCKSMEKDAFRLEDKIQHYHKLCLEYEKMVETKRGEQILRQIEKVKDDIEKISKHLSHNLHESYKILKK